MKHYDRNSLSGGFRCAHCRQFVVINQMMGTMNRNHCNWCLWSKHVDNNKGDRLSECHGGMEPIGLTFKHEGYGKIGEIMLIHLCKKCQKISINRIARDDPEYKIVEVFGDSCNLNDAIKRRLDNDGIYLMRGADSRQLATQMYGERRG